MSMALIIGDGQKVMEKGQVYLAGIKLARREYTNEKTGKKGVSLHDAPFRGGEVVGIQKDGSTIECALKLWQGNKAGSSPTQSGFMPDLL